jgi:hypothetical protein
MPHSSRCPYHPEFCVSGSVQMSLTRYARELSALADTYREALAWDADGLVRVVGTLATQALRVTGSGGSYSLAAFCARLHISITGQAAMAATPLDVVQTPYLNATGLLCLTASGRNRDIRAAFEASALAETKPTAALCLVRDSPIKGLHERYGFTDLVEAPLRIAPDGFLAVNSLLAVCVLLARAYRGAMQRTDALPPDFAALMAYCDIGEHFDRDVRRVLECGTVSVLYSPVLGAAATDLESRFVEGALGNLHAADWRNFGHGRHHWLAKRGSETGVLAFTSDADAALARRTLATVPADIPRAAVRFKGEADVQAICALTVALRIAEVAGSLIGIDPGRPGVPEFGRKLFGLGPRLGRPNARHIAVSRKLRVAPDIEAILCRDYSAVTGRIAGAQACGIVLDYDGTLSDRRRRFDPLEVGIGQSLKHAAATGTMIGIATGRGRSAGLALQEILPPNTWSRVLMGYYNGAVIVPLGQDPPVDTGNSAGAKAVGEFLQAWFPQAQIEVRSCQVSASGFRYGQLPLIAHTVSRLLASEELPSYVVCSSHSIDVLLTSARKTAVVAAVRSAAGCADDVPVIRVGDRGRWPGNDFDLLSDVLGLSVDEVSSDPLQCWNLAPPGLLGPQAAVYYLDRLIGCGPGRVRLDLSEDHPESGQS